MAILMSMCLTASLATDTTTTYATWAEAAAAAQQGTDYTISEDTNTYTIKTAKGLAWFAASVNGTLSDGEGGTITSDDYEGKTVTLANDIDLTTAGVTGYDKDTIMTGDYTGGNSWTPIGSSSKYFNGTFDGGSHTISNLYINTSTTSSTYTGLFGYVETEGKVSNVTVSGGLTATCTYNLYAGSVVGCNEGIVSNCSASGNVTATITSTNTSNAITYAGGVVGYHGG